MVSNFKRTVAVGTSIAAIALASVTSVHAQDVSNEAVQTVASTNDETPIIVTGTRIARPEVESASPVISISGDRIAQSGETNLTDLLAETPGLTGSITSIRRSGVRAGPGGAGVNLLDLRNLGEDRTLVLVDGRRHVASLAGSAAVDINTIPVALIERVDVLTGGVSAIYGADGVSGVVNFVLKDDFDGIDARLQNGISSRGDANEYYGALTAGRNFASGAGNIALSYEFRRSDRVAGNARKSGNPDDFFVLRQNGADLPDDPNVPDRIPYNNVRFGNTSPLGAVDLNFDRFPEFNGLGQPYNLGQFIPNSGGLTQGGDSTQIAGNDGDLLPQTETHVANLLASYEFSPAFRVFAEGKYVSSKSFTERQFPRDNGILLYADNPFLPDTVRNAIVPGALAAFFGAPPGFLPDAVVVVRDAVDLGRHSQRANRETWRGVLGVEGDLTDRIGYEVAYTYGRTTNDFTDGNYRIFDRYLAAIDAVATGPGSFTCKSNLIPPATMFDLNMQGRPTTTFTPGPDSGCVPVNILGGNAPSQAARDFFMTDLESRVKLTQHVVTGSVSGDLGAAFELPGGPVGFAVGGEYREERSNFTPDPLLQQGAIFDLVQVNPEGGSFDVWEAFAEVQAPLLRDVPGAHLLTVGGAVRYSDYSTVGSTTAWKVDGVYAPIADVRVRASYSQSVRAPNIGELFAAPSGSTRFLLDPCDISRLSFGSADRAANCAALLGGLGIDPATYNPLGNPFASPVVGGLVSGNADLREETAKTWTAGVVFTPTFAPRLVASIDWYDIKLRNAVSTPTAQELADLCVDQPSLNNPFCGNVTRDPASGRINSFLEAPANVSRFRSSGIDFTANYTFEPAPNLGRVNLRLVGSYLDKLSFIASPGAAPASDKRDYFAPEWSGNFDITWKRNNLTANYGINYFSGTRRFDPAVVASNPDIAEPRLLSIRDKMEHDVQLAVSTDDERMTFYSGVNNLFDRGPALGETNYPVSFRGRFFYFGIRAGL